MIRWIFLLLLSSTCFAGHWIDEQIDQDLKFLSTHPISAKRLTASFDALCKKKDSLAVYFQIRGNKVKWIKTTRKKDLYRMERMYNYFKELSSKYALPDTDLIISIHDSEGPSSYPIFSFAKKKGSNTVLLLPDFDAFRSGIKEDGVARNLSQSYPWESKKPMALFRGATTGKYNPSSFAFGNDRARVIYYSYEHPDLVDATFSHLLQYPQPVLQEIGNWLSSLGKSLEGKTQSEHYAYKYLLDVDGNSCSFLRCRWILFSNSVLVKVMTEDVQWYYSALKPGHHFIPVKRDLSDLEERLNFLKANDSLAYQVAKNGQEIAREVFSEEMIDRYVLTLLNRYAKCIHL